MAGIFGSRRFRFPRRDKAQVRKDLDAELSFHLDMRERELIEAGLSSGHARREAIRQFGDLEGTRQYCDAIGERMEREVRRTEWVDSVRQDVKYGWRTLRGSPGFMAAAVLCLALAIGANTAIFSIVNGLLLRPLPYPNAHELYVVWTDLPDFGHEVASLPDFVDWRAQNRAFSDMAAAARSNVNLISSGEPERVIGALVTSNFFEVMGVPPARGRAFSKEEQGPATPRVVILSDGLWRRRFGGLPSIIGTNIDSNTGVGADAVPMHEDLVGDTRLALLILWAAVGFVLLIACANVASLLMARGAARSREMSLRAALGARRGRIVRQLLTESLLLSLMAGGLGVLLAQQAIQALVALQPGNLPRLETLSIDRRALAFSLGASLMTGMLFGLFPALQVSRPEVLSGLKEGGRGGGDGRGHRRTRNLLVIVETALAMILLVGAGLMVRSFVALQQVDIGIRVDNLVTMRVSLPPARYPDDSQVSAFVDQLVTRLRSLPGVQSAGAMNALYFAEGGFPIETFDIEGAQPPSPGQTPDAHIRSFTPGTQRLLGIRVLRGRELTGQDGAGDRLVAVVNEAMVKRYFGGKDPIGRRLAFGDGTRWREIVGVVADVRQLGPAEATYPEVQLPAAQFMTYSFSLIVQTTTPPAGIANAVRAELRALDPTQPIYAVQTVEEVMAERIARPRFTMLLFLLFAITAVVLAGVGIYGLVSYSVTQRRQEVGVRMALGAQPGDILRMIVGQGMALALVGLAIGIAGGLGLSRFLAGLLFEVSLTDPLTYGAIAALLTLVALVASYIPARRALKIAPMGALRE